MPGTGGRGRIVGPQPSTAGERAALGALYCALMTDQSLDAVGSRSDIIIDGPFGENALFCGGARSVARAAARLPLGPSRRHRGGRRAAWPYVGREDLPRLKLELTPVEPLADAALRRLPQRMAVARAVIPARDIEETP